jgi:hypothetical protein
MLLDLLCILVFLDVNITTQILIPRHELITGFDQLHDTFLHIPNILLHCLVLLFSFIIELLEVLLLVLQKINLEQIVIFQEI